MVALCCSETFVPTYKSTRLTTMKTNMDRFTAWEPQMSIKNRLQSIYVHKTVSLIVSKSVLVGAVSISPEIWFGLAAICRGAIGICSRGRLTPFVGPDLNLGGWLVVRGAQTGGCSGWREGSLSARGETFHYAFIAFPGAIKWFHCYVKSGHIHTYTGKALKFISWITGWKSSHFMGTPVNSWYYRELT
jgi:hypothetical protein